MINYAAKDLAITLDPDIEQYYNENRLRLLVCKWVYHPKGECERYINKVKELVREVGFMQFERGIR